MTDLRDRLRIASDTIVDLPADEYPALTAYFKKTSGKRCLIGLLDVLRSYDKPMFTMKNGKAYYAVSQRYLIMVHGGSQQTWNSCLTFLAVIGLIERIRPSKDSRIPAIKAMYEKAKEKKLSSQLLYSIPEYTPEVLRKADEVVALWKSKGVSTSNITKLSVVTVIGKQEADRSTITIHRPGSDNEAAIKEMLFRITKTVEAKGYTTKNEVLAMTATRTPRTEYQLERIWKQVHNSILQEAGASYHRPTKEQKEQFNLANDNWIITKKS